jgi:hypothetical protein
MTTATQLTDMELGQFDAEADIAAQIRLILAELGTSVGDEVIAALARNTVECIEESHDARDELEQMDPEAQRAQMLDYKKSLHPTIN